MTAFSFTAVGGFQGEGGITFSADLLIAIVFFSDGGDGGIHDSSSESEDEVEG